MNDSKPCGASEDVLKALISYKEILYASESERYVVVLEREGLVEIHTNFSICKAAPYLWANPAVFTRMPPLSHGVLRAALKQPLPSERPYWAFDIEVYHASDMARFKTDCEKEIEHAKNIVAKGSFEFRHQQDESDLLPDTYWVECPPGSMTWGSINCPDGKRGACMGPVGAEYIGCVSSHPPTP